MRFGLGILFALVVHAAVLAFGGLLFLGKKEEGSKHQEVELLSDDTTTEEKKEEEPEEPSEEQLEVETEEPPDAAEIIRNLEISAAASAPELESVSLSAIELALSGVGGSGDFADALTFQSGGRIGGTGKASALDEGMDRSFDLTEIDQKPRVVFQIAPLYPSEMRGKKLEGVVTIIFVVDASGRVTSPKVEKSTHSAFDKPAMDALKQWKFEPAVKGGQRVGCKMRQSLRFTPS